MKISAIDIFVHFSILVVVHLSNVNFLPLQNYSKPCILAIYFPFRKLFLYEKHIYATGDNKLNLIQYDCKSLHSIV